MSSTAEPTPDRPIKVVQLVSRLNVGGLPVLLVLLADRMRPPEFETLLVTGHVVPEDREGDMAYYATAHGVTPIYIDTFARPFRPWRDLQSFVALYRLFRRERPDVVHTHQAKPSILGRTAAWLARVPVIVHTFHGHLATGHIGERLTRLILALERRLAHLTTTVCTVSAELEADILRLGLGLPGRTLVTPYGLELDRFATVERYGGVLRRELGVGPEAPLVVFVGRLEVVKRPDLVVETARQVLAARPDARFVLIGDGDLRPLIEAYLAEHGLAERVHLLGWRQDVPELLADADVLLNHAVMEGTPLVIIEAGAAGVPAVASRVGGCADMIEHGETGWLFPSGDVDAAARLVLDALADPEATRRCGSRARERFLAANASPEQMAELHADLYRRLLAEHRRRK